MNQHLLIDDFSRPDECFAFNGQATMRGFDVSGLKSTAPVTYGAAFDADIDVARIEFAR